MPVEQFSVVTPAGHKLAGALELPSGLLRGAALFAHCFTCTKQSKAAIEVTRALAREGIATLRFDFTGLGASEGEFGRAGFASDVDDLIASADALCRRFGDGILLVGHSLGGAAVLAAAGRLAKGKIAAIATIAAPSDVPHVLHNIDGNLDQIRQAGEGAVTIGGRPFTLSRTFLDQTTEFALLDRVAALRIPLMFCHSPTDQIVGIDHASDLFGAARHPKSFISLAGADHLLTKAGDARFAAAVIASWAERYLPLKTDWPMPAEGVIACTGHGRFGTEVHTRAHRFIADEPRAVGGDDAGPTPYDLLSAALATCTAMTMKMYADRKGLPLAEVNVQVTHERDHAEDLDHAIDGGTTAQALHRRISIRSAGLGDEGRRKLMEIADKCPVHRTLEGHLHIHTSEADPSD